MVGNAELIRELFIAASDGPESDDEQTVCRDQFRKQLPVGRRRVHHPYSSTYLCRL